MSKLSVFKYLLNIIQLNKVRQNSTILKYTVFAKLKKTNFKIFCW